MVAIEMTLETIRSILGKPAYEDGDVLLYQDDSAVLLPQLPESCISLTVTSPPYNIGKCYERVKPVDAYVAWLAAWVNEVHRATAASGAFWLNLGYLPLPNKAKALPIPYLIWSKIDFFSGAGNCLELRRRGCGAIVLFTA
jgi:adenine-specific DNA-methyltransferase